MEKMEEKSKEIIDFVKEGRNLLTVEGLKLLEESNYQELKDAAAYPEVMDALLFAINNTKDPYLKRKLFQALG